ncbi:putative bifunctional diguanylate cyclase/phosphodiesterase [uncultured Jatrophihabitans sp.]|uniref:putative bifunctional diguanylate cyclase/phosphodiesterase n=1 Tax=uncultured Jatrophihabitans sp. TaxID=1610747 RepID=UPI0035CA449B
MQWADRVLGRLVWLLLPAGVGIDLAVTGWRMQPNRSAVTYFCAVFFAALCARLVLAVIRRGTWRTPTMLLLAALVMWCVESASLQGASSGDGQAHLAAGEILFLVSYVLFVLFLVFDVDQRPSRALSASLDAAIVCGGSACAAGPLVVLVLGGSGAAPWVALLYPVLDLALVGLVVAQIVLRVRRNDRCSHLLIAGFVTLAAADLGFVNRVMHGSTGSDVVSVTLWGAGFALIVAAASMPRAAAGREATGEVPAAVLALSGVAAVVVLLLRPELRLGGAVALLGAATLAATGTRLYIALRDARSASRAIELSMTDDLTGLPNRRAINAQLAQDLADDVQFGLMIMDLDGFKEINDTLGHDYGDAVLHTAAARMRAALPESVHVARLGGDEFALIAPTVDELDLMEIAASAMTEVRRPDFVDGIELIVDASIGITTREPSDTSGSAILRRADVAMYQAKANTSGIVIYEPESDDFTRRRLRLTEELRHGVAQEQFEVHYQPQIGAADQHVVGVEALIRWRHSDGSLASPLSFLSIARNAGLMPRLGEMVIDMAAGDLARWRAQGLRTRIALNCAPPELMSGIFVRQLLNAVERCGLEPGDFVLEVTEDSFVSDPERARMVLAEVRQAGLQISIDDYGTGFSSLAYLRDLPVDELKIDRSFVGSMVGDPRVTTIVDSTVRLAHALGLRVVAEGVEDAVTSAALIAIGVDVMQGYHFARPLPADAAEAWISEWQQAASAFPGLASG